MDHIPMMSWALKFSLSGSFLAYSTLFPWITFPSQTKNAIDKYSIRKQYTQTMIIQIWSRKHGQVLLRPDVFFFPMWLPRFRLFYMTTVLVTVPWPKMTLLFTFWVFWFYYGINILHIMLLRHDIKDKLIYF